MVLGSSSHGGERKGQGTSPYTPVSGDHMWVGPDVGGTRCGALTINLLLALLGLPPYPRHHLFLLGGMLDLTSSLVLARPLQVKELFAAFAFITLLMLI